jgi:hypothetical protein
MNKTLRTIGWICLALGVLGILAGASALVIGRQFAADRQAAIAEVREAVQDGERLERGQLCIAQDADGDGKPDGECIEQQDWQQKFAPRQGGQVGGRLMQSSRPMVNRRAAFSLGGLPIFLFALGPVLAVIGAVILLVNREPKENITVEDEKKTTKAKSVK